MLTTRNYVRTITVARVEWLVELAPHCKQPYLFFGNVCCIISLYTEYIHTYIHTYNIHSLMREAFLLKGVS